MQFLSAFPGCACGDFRRALFPQLAFHATCPSSLSHIHRYTYVYAYTLCIPFLFVIFLSLSLLLLRSRKYPDILNSNSIARFSRRKSLPSKWLCPISPPRLTISRISFSYLPSHAPDTFFNSDLRAVFAGPAAGR